MRQDFTVSWLGYGIVGFGRLVFHSWTNTQLVTDTESPASWHRLFFHCYYYLYNIKNLSLLPLSFADLPSWPSALVWIWLLLSCLGRSSRNFEALDKHHLALCFGTGVYSYEGEVAEEKSHWGWSPVQCNRLSGHFKKTSADSIDFNKHGKNAFPNVRAQLNEQKLKNTWEAMLQELV